MNRASIAGTSDVAGGTIARIAVDGHALQAIVHADGSWNITAPSTSDGSYLVTAAITDPAGNVGIDTQSLQVDTTAPVAAFVGELMDFFAHSYKDEQGFDYPPVHDPVAVAYVIDPTVLTVRKAPLDVELTGTITLGMTVADLRAPAPDDCTTQVATGLDADKFWGLVTDAIRRIG